MDEPTAVDGAPGASSAPAALDPVDRIILDQAAAQLADAGARHVAVLDDVTGRLAVAAAASVATGPSPDGAVRVHCDSLADETRVAAVAASADGSVRLLPELGEALLRGARVVLIRLPKSLAALDEMAEAVARFADPEVTIVAGGRTKHMSRGMNQVLGRHFTAVAASLGQQKSRALLASGPRPTTTSSYPRSARHEDLDLTVCAHGAAFAGTDVDLGTRMLASVLPEVSPAQAVVDLGCGTGVLAALAARQLPGARVTAVDDSSAACRSAACTAAANGLADRIRVQRVDLLTDGLDPDLGLVLCNPPFHRGTARDSDAAFAMFAAAGRALRPGGELWTVYNGHLPYLAALRRLVGTTRVVRQDPRYLVTRSVASGVQRRRP
jgi:16S rRNA (guanine1207-N2)-methyltransferase